MPSAQKIFFPFLAEHFPRLEAPYRKLYANSAFLGGKYKQDLRRRIEAVRSRHRLAGAPIDYRPELAGESAQFSLFP